MSLYNETNGEAIYPTPMIGMVGLIEDLSTITTAAFKQADDLIYLVGETHGDFNGSELQKLQTGEVTGKLFDFDLEAEKQHQHFVLKAIREHLITAAHDLSDGGLLVAWQRWGLMPNLAPRLTSHCQLLGDFPRRKAASCSRWPLKIRQHLKHCMVLPN